MNTNTENLKYTSVGQLVAENYKTAQVFKKHGIDFCCGGRISLDEACKKVHVDIEDLKKELHELDRDPSAGVEFQRMPLDVLIDYIINVHHKYVEENLPMLREYTKKIAKVHYDTNPELKDIYKIFLEVASELEQHMMKEEQILFPYIKKMLNPEKYSEAGGCGSFGSVENPINMMENEHENAGEAFRKIRELSQDFDYPPHACNTYIVTFKKLQEFEEDLHRHIHLENNILFPKAIQMEKETNN